MMRTIGLIGLIVFDVCLLVTLGIFHQWYWFFTFLSITLVVGVFEGLSYTVYGKTISQQYQQFRKDHPIGSLLALAFFGLAMASLIVHLL